MIIKFFSPHLAAWKDTQPQNSSASGLH